jgi:hypothetical protein
MLKYPKFYNLQLFPSTTLELLRICQNAATVVPVFSRFFAWSKIPFFMVIWVGQILDDLVEFIDGRNHRDQLDLERD